MPHKERFTLFGFCFPGAKILQSPVLLSDHALSYIQQISANLPPPEMGRLHTNANVCTVRFGTKALSSIFFELWFVVPS